MIIDADAHISPTQATIHDIKVDELLRRMDKAGVDQALVWLRPQYMPDVPAGNRYIYESVQAHPDRLLGFGWVDPHYGYQAACDEISRCVEEYGFYGVKLNGAQNQFYIDDPQKSLPLIEKIVETGKALAFHIGTDAYEATHPFRLGKIAALFPQARILMVHMGGVGFHDLSNAAIEILEEYPNITAIGSANRAVNILRALKQLGADRICFGSDTPFNLLHVEVAIYRALMDGEFTEAEQRAVWSENIRRVLGING